MRSAEKILEYLKKESKQLEIPDSIKPKQVYERLRQQGEEQERKELHRKEEAANYAQNEAKIHREEILYGTEEGKEIIKEKHYMEEKKVSEQGFVKEKEQLVRKKGLVSMKRIITTAACICIIVGSIVTVWNQGWLDGYKTGTENGDDIFRVQNTETTKDGAEGIEDAASPKEQKDSKKEDAVISEGITYPTITYGDIYASMLPDWQEKYGEQTRRVAVNGAMMADDGTVAVYETETAEGAMAEKSAGSEKQKVMFDVAEDMMSSGSAFGTTNVQTVGVEEGDVVKNDGRYLYQIITVEEEYRTGQAIQILDTKDGLKEIGRLEDFESIEEFYIWEDVLVVIEKNKIAMETEYLHSSESIESNNSMESNNSIESENTVEKTKSRLMVCSKADWYNNYYHEISFYELKERSNPKKIKTFTLQGKYTSSRIADGYFYGFSRFYANLGAGEENYDAYVPKLDGVRLETSEILLPKDSTGTSYLVLVSVDLRNPVDFVQTTGIVTGSELYYVSSSNIYVTDSLGAEEKEGWSSDTTSIRRFSYEDGKFTLQAEGEIKGRLDDSFSLDEYDGYLRAVSTVREYKRDMLTDDRTGEIIGYEYVDERQTNALYILDEKLKLTGRIEGLAEGEQIYSARFMGDIGYFVTFRQTDPLFAVDLTDQTNPKVLSELKVSGFSEYLHVYGEDRLLGIGMEADEETGQQEGMKLSMFDISDNSNVQETARLPLSKYNYSEALYNHRAVLIHPGVNLIGFEAEGSNRGEYWKEYLVFSYENDAFVQKLKLDTKGTEGEYYSVRGTFIGDTFYLLYRNGKVQSYDLNTGALLEVLEP